MFGHKKKSIFAELKFFCQCFKTAKFYIKTVPLCILFRKYFQVNATLFIFSNISINNKQEPDLNKREKKK